MVSNNADSKDKSNSQRKTNNFVLKRKRNQIVGHVNSIPLRKNSLPMSFGEFIKSTNVVEVTKNVIQRTSSLKSVNKRLKDEKLLRYKAYELYNSYMHSAKVHNPPFCCIKAFKGRSKMADGNQSNGHGSSLHICASCSYFDGAR